MAEFPELVEQAFLAVRRAAFAEGVRWAASYLHKEARKEGNAIPTVGSDKTVEIELLKAAKPIIVGCAATATRSNCTPTTSLKANARCPARTRQRDPKMNPAKIEVLEMNDGAGGRVFDAVYRAYPELEGIGLTREQALEALAGLLGDAFIEMRTKHLMQVMKSRAFPPVTVTSRHAFIDWLHVMRFRIARAVSALKGET